MKVLVPVKRVVDVMQVSEIIKVVAADTFERPIYAGNASQTVGEVASASSISIAVREYIQT